MRKLFGCFFSFLEFISLLFLHRGLSLTKKKEMAQAFDPLGGGGGPKKKKTTVKESAQISEITENDARVTTRSPRRT